MNTKLEGKTEENIQFITSSKIIYMLNNKCTGAMWRKILIDTEGIKV